LTRSTQPCVRLGLALSYYHLGKIDIAKHWFQRVVELEPTNVEALVGLGVLTRNSYVVAR